MCKIPNVGACALSHLCTFTDFYFDLDSLFCTQYQSLLCRHLKLVVFAVLLFLMFLIYTSWCIKAKLETKNRYVYIHSFFSSFFFDFPGIPTSSQPTMTVTAQRRQPPVVPLTLTSDLHLQQSPQQLSPTLSSPVSITQVRIN